MRNREKIIKIICIHLLGEGGQRGDRNMERRQIKHRDGRPKWGESEEKREK